MSNGLYIYGLAARAGLPDAAPLGPGIAGAALRWIEAPGQAAAASFAALASAAPEEAIAPTRRNMLTHTAVLERAMRETPVLPVRFGTVAPAEAAFIACLTAHAPAFATALGGIAGRVELGVKASWRPEAMFAGVVEDDPALRAARDQLAGRPAAQTYYERIELGRRIEATLAARRAAATRAILAALSPLAERTVELKLLDDAMILNAAFLVPQAAEPHFDAAMEALGAQFGDRVLFRYVGPIPPYNFVSLRADLLAAA
jgi:hypothetical protein